MTFKFIQSQSRRSPNDNEGIFSIIRDIDYEIDNDLSGTVDENRITVEIGTNTQHIFGFNGDEWRNSVTARTSYSKEKELNEFTWTEAIKALEFYHAETGKWDLEHLKICLVNNSTDARYMKHKELLNTLILGVYKDLS